MKTPAVEFPSGCRECTVSPHGDKVESIPESALEEIEGGGTCRSLLSVELLLFFPRGRRHWLRPLHDACNKFNSRGPAHPLTLKGRNRLK